MSPGSYKFLTCDGLLQGELSGPKFGNLVSAYGMEAWVALLVLGFVSAIILKFIHSSGKVIVLSDTLLLALALLLEQGINIPTFRNKLLSSTCILAPWLLMFVVLSNGYRGSNVTELTSPLKGTFISNFKELIDHKFTLFVPVLKYYHPIRHMFMESQNSYSRLANSFHEFGMRLK